MPAAPRKDISNLPTRVKEPAEAVKQVQPAVTPKAPDGGAPDVFERFAPATGAAAAVAAAREAGAARLHQVPGTVPSPREFLPGDRFAPRSSYPDLGRDERPTLRPAGPDHVYASTDALEAALEGSRR